jgi:hypothetical protein
MNNETLLRRVKEAACSCDPMLGWTCSFCQELLPELRKALAVRYRDRTKENCYKPKRMRAPKVDPGLRW